MTSFLFSLGRESADRCAVMTRGVQGFSHNTTVVPDLESVSANQREQISTTHKERA